MVSLRRRKLLGLCAGRSSFLTPLPRLVDNGIAPVSSGLNAWSVSVHPLPSDDIRKPGERIIAKVGAGSYNVSASSSSKEQQAQPYPGELACPDITQIITVDIDLQIHRLHKMFGQATCNIIEQHDAQDDGVLHSEAIEEERFVNKIINKVSSSGQPIKRRKRHRRKHVQNQELCLMRGVYFKNMKWQAAIKVDKKQIHLGTVGSQEEAAHLYDRAAFMCGREPNFELSEEEKQELRKFKWDEFLAITRSAINNKKHKRRSGSGLQKKSEPILQNVDSDSKQGVNSFSASEDVEPDSSTS